MIFKKYFYIFVTILMFLGNVYAQGLKVDVIRFTGNEHFSNSELRALIKSEEKKPFNNKYLRLDVTILTNYYQNRGFLNVWINSDIERRGNKINIIFNIKEGIRFVLGGIEVSGGGILNKNQIRNAFSIKKGDVFLQSEIDNGLNKLEKYYYNHGKPYVTLNRVQTEQDSSIFVKLDVQENETVFIRDIDYQGLARVKSFIVRRELAIGKGDIYSRNKIDKSQGNIYSTGLFDFVGMQLQAMDSTRSQARLLVKLVEKKSRWVGVRFGVAYEQEILYGGTFDFSFGFGHRNLFGTARTASVEVIPSLSYDFQSHKIINPKNQYTFTFIEPWIGYTRTPGIFRASFYQVRPMNSADYNYFSSSFQIHHEYNNAWQASGTIAFNNVKVLEQDTLAESFFTLTKGQDFIYSLSTDFLRDKRDNYLNPQEGSVLETTIKFAYSRSRDKLTGSASVNRFFKLTGQWNRYQAFVLKRNWVLASRVRAGDIIELGKRAQIPVLERFYLGGASTVRGYPEQLLGPVSYDENGRPIAIGGKLMLLGNLELRIPIFWLFWGEVFVDAGNVWLENSDFKITDIKTSTGAGAALMTPLGPVRFDYGVKLQPRRNEAPGEFHISISFAF
ncbi:MAG: BamA/TamA family outer membrane protein [Calditrichia bacterium]